MVTVPAAVPVPPVGVRPGFWHVPDDGMVSRSARARGTGSYEATLPAPLAHADLTVPLELSAAVSDAGILQEATGRSRNRVWVQKDVLSILDTYAEQARRRA